MATYLLDGSGSAHLPRRPLSVSVSVSGRSRSGVRLTARLAGGAQAPARIHSPSMIIIPRVDDEIIIAAVPDAGRAQFDEDTTLHVTIGPDSHDDPDADYAQLAPREVSGLTTIELASLTPVGGEQVKVTTRLAVADTALPPLASRARVACRGALGVDALPEHQQVSLACVIDTSTSMASLFAEGSVSAAIEMVTGVAAVTAGRAPLRLVLTDPGYTEISATALSAASTMVAGEIQHTGFGVGADLDRAVEKCALSANFIVVVTDSMPREGHGAATTSWLVLSASARRVAGFAGAVLAPAPKGIDARAYYDSNPHLVDRTVAELITPLRNQVASR